MKLKGNFQLLNDKRSPLRLANPNLRTLISIGGWTYSKEFSEVCNNKTKLENFIHSAIDFMFRHGFDGIGILLYNNIE